MHDPEEVKKLVERLNAISNLWAVLDFKRYDKRVSALIWRLIIEYVMEFYRNRPTEENNARRNMLRSISEAYIIVMIDGKFYVVHVESGLVSGLLLTSIVGSLGNAIAQFLALMFLVDPEWPFKTYSEMLRIAHLVRSRSASLVYGDDTLLACTLDGFSVNALATIIEDKFGMIVTNEIETDSPTGCVDFRKAMFLARQFDIVNVDGKDLYIAKLRLVSIVKQLMYDRDSTSKEEIYLKWKNAIGELSLHDKRTYDHYMSIMLPAMQSLGFSYVIGSQEDVRMEALSVPIIAGEYAPAE